MKKFAGAVLLMLGIAMVWLCFTLRGQFASLVDSPVPAGDYPLIELVMPKPSSSPKAANPADLAKKINFRIHAIGALGVVLAIAGTVCLVAPKREAIE